MNTTQIDLLQLIPVQAKKVAGTNGGEYHSPCPFCGGNDRFIMHPYTDKPSWFCRQCNRKGDAITFVMEYENVDFKGAMERLNLASEYQPKPRSLAKSQPKARELEQAVVNTEYQEKSMIFAEWAWKQLFSGNYPEVGDYLLGRGFDELTMDINMIGYNPKPFNRVWGGVDVYLPVGIVIPWLYQEKVYRLRFRVDNAKQKYTQAKGGANWLYGADRMKLASCVVLVESELDALSIVQTFNYFKLAPVATGGITGARLVQWRSLLSLAHTVLVAFDTDEPGENAAEYWLNALPNAKRLKPLAHDVNDMLTSGMDIHQWILKAVSLAI